MANSGGTAGTPKSAIDTNFNRYLEKLRINAAVLQNAFQGKTQRKWLAVDNAGLDPSVLPDRLLERKNLNAAYDEITGSGTPGTLGDIIATKLQLDYLAMAERAARARAVSLPRAAALAHGRRYGQAHGAIFTDAPGGIPHAISNYIRSGGLSR